LQKAQISWIIDLVFDLRKAISLLLSRKPSLEVAICRLGDFPFTFQLAL